jgi:hypothetical protein
MIGKWGELPRGYMDAQKAFNAALAVELAAAKVFGADRTEANWLKCVEAHDAAMKAAAVCHELEPDWLKSDD